VAARARETVPGNLESGLKPESDPAWAAWESAVDAFYAALDAAYPPGFWDDYDRLRRGDSAGLDTAVRFLEADPWFFRTGYLKASLLRRIRRFSLTPDQTARLRNVVLSVVQRRDGREFREYCRLARKVDGPELRSRLQGLAVHSDPRVRRRAGWVTYFLAHDRFQPVPPPRIRDGLVAAYEQLRAGNPRGLDPVVRYLESRPWTPRYNFAKQTLIGLLARFDLSPDMVRRLQNLVISEIERPFCGPLKEIGTLAERIDTPEFRQSLKQKRMDSLGQAEYRAYCALDELEHPRPFLWRSYASAEISWESTGWHLADLVQQSNLLQRLRAKDTAALDEVIALRLMFVHWSLNPPAPGLTRQIVRLMAR
jgi:hypothetical protein